MWKKLANYVNLPPKVSASRLATSQRTNEDTCIDLTAYSVTALDGVADYPSIHPVSLSLSHTCLVISGQRTFQCKQLTPITQSVLICQEL